MKTKMYYDSDEPAPRVGNNDVLLKRHHTAKYYAHKVHESLTTRFSKFICSIILFIVFVLGLIAFILWLSLRPHRPRFYIDDFSIPVLAQPNGFENAQINFNVTVRNLNRKIVVHYESIQVTVYYKDINIGGLVLVSQAFAQEPKNTTNLVGMLSGATLTVSSQRWAEFQSDRSAGNVDFRLEITSVIKFDIFSWHTHNHKMYANCDAMVGQNGLILDTAKAKRCPTYFT